MSVFAYKNTVVRIIPAVIKGKQQYQIILNNYILGHVSRLSTAKRIAIAFLDHLYNP